MHHRRLAAFPLIAALAMTGCVEDTPDAPDSPEFETQQQELFFHAPPAPAPDCEPQRVLRSDLLAPVRVTLSPERNLIVAEGGTFAANNTGRISRVSPDGASRTTLLDGLPSAITTDGVPGGPTSIEVKRPKRLYVTFGRGDSTVGGAFPGQDVPNPNGPASPLFSSLVRFDFTKKIDDIPDGFTLSAADQAALAAGETVRLSNGPGNRVTARLVADIPDLEEIPGKGIVPSNPFGLVVFDRAGKVAFTTDSSRNSLERIDLRTGEVTRVVTYDEVPNPLPFGPPSLEAVPTSVRFYDGQLLTTLETGFPFPIGSASIESIAFGSFDQTTFLGGLTQAIDLTIARRFGADSFYVVELSSNLLAEPPEPGRLLRFDGPGSDPVVLSSTLAGPSGVAYDRVSRTAYVTEAFTFGLVAVDEACAESKL